MEASSIPLADLGVPAAISDAQGNIGAVNDAWRGQMAGMFPQGSRLDAGMSLIAFYRAHALHEEGPTAAGIRSVLAGGAGSFQGDWHVPGAAGGGWHISVMALHQRGAGYALVTLSDLPDVRVATDRELLFQANPHPMWVYDLETLAFIAVNDAAIAKYGYSREEFLAMTIKDIRPDEDVPRLLRNIEQVQDGLDEAGYWRHRRKDGSIILVEITSHVLVFQGRRSELVMAIDVTDRRKAELEVIRARDEAEAANRAKDRFMATLSHELRTPLTPVLATLSAMQQDPELPAAMRDDVAMMLRSVELEARLIDDLLDMARIVRGRLGLELQKVDGGEMLERALQVTRPNMQARQLIVETDLVAQHTHVRADPVRLQQVFWNLLRNAAKFTPPGGRITVRSYNDASQQWVVQVVDTGIGIAPALLPRLFDAFQQSELPDHRLGGLGLGLSISRSIIDLMSGRIEAASSGPGKGSTFTVTLPTLGAGEVVRPSVPAEARTDVCVTPLCILLVEDDPNTAEVLARLLGKRGHRVTAVGSAQEALAVAAEREFGLLISDIGLPDGTGWDLMRQLRLRRGLRGIALSGYGMEDDFRRSREAGFDEHLVKPINLQKLMMAVQLAAGPRSRG